MFLYLLLLQVRTPLHFAAETGSAQTVKVLLASGADKDSKDVSSQRLSKGSANDGVKGLRCYGWVGGFSARWGAMGAEGICREEEFHL